MESLIQEIADPFCDFQVVEDGHDNDDHSSGSSIIVKFVKDKTCPNGDMFTGQVNAVTGELIHGTRIYKETQECYDGPFVNGKRHGMGMCTKLDGGGKFLGEFKNEEYHNGTLVTERYTYTGFFAKGLFHGEGWLACSDGSLYDGVFENGVFHGQGKLTNSDGECYAGGFRHGKKQGYGIMHYSNGCCYAGDWDQDAKDGVGCETCANKHAYEGEYVMGERHGKGTIKTAAVIATGPWREDRPLDGAGWTIEYVSTGVRYTGEAVSCRPHGVGVYSFRHRDTNEIFTYEGQVRCGLRHGRGRMIDPSSKTMSQTVIWKGDLEIPPPLDNSNEPFDSSLEINLQELPSLEEIDSISNTSSSNSGDSPPSLPEKSKEGEDQDKDFKAYPNGDTFHGHIDVFRQRQGFGIYTNASTGMTYSGQWKSSKKHGKGTVTQPLTGVQFIGIFIEDVMSGGAASSLRLPDGSTYVGTFLDGTMHGRGTFHDVTNEITYAGEFRESLKHGHGEETYADNTVYVGPFVNGKRSGSDGCLYRQISSGNSSNSKSQDHLRNLLYQGDWLEDRITGEGKRFELETPCAGHYAGRLKDAKRHGHGTFTADNGYIYEGEWSDDVPVDGDWVITCPKGSVYYGEAVCHEEDGVPIANGFGTHNESDGSFYSGGFANGKRHGSGLCVFSTGEQWDGRWEKGLFVRYGRSRP